MKIFPRNDGIFLPRKHILQYFGVPFKHSVFQTLGEGFLQNKQTKQAKEEWFLFVRSTVQGPTVGEAKRVGSKKRRPSGTVKEKATARGLAKSNLKFKKKK